MSERDSVTILHLSDTQFGKNHRFGDLPVNTLASRLLIDLERLRKDHGVAPEMLVLSGDLAEWGKKKEFDEATELLVSLSDGLKIPRKHVVIVPGNHDINRDACLSYFAECAGDDKEPVKPYWPKWKHFAGMFDEFYREVERVTFTDKQWWTLWEMTDLRVVVAGLNSTMAESHLDGTHYGEVGEEQLRWFLKELERYSAEEWVRLGVVHHNPTRGAVDDDEHLRDADDLRRLLGPSLDLLLHGHTHNGRLEMLGNLPVLSTGSAALKQEQRLAEIPNQYQCVRLSATGIKRSARRYDPSDKRWIGDTRCSADGGKWITKEKASFPAFRRAAKPRMAKPREARPPVQDPSRYIEALRREIGEFDVQGLKFGDNRAYRFPIEEFYIPLMTSGDMRTGPVALEQAMAAQRNLLIVGDPGSGKSTFLKRATYDLCKGFKRGSLLPLPIGAAALSDYIALHHRKDGPADASSPEWIPAFAGAECREKNRGLDVDFFRAKLKAGACHVLIDGLDETPDEPSRERLARLIHTAARAYDGCRFTVTSRPEGKTLIADFHEALIADLEPEAIRAFLATLARQLYHDDEARERMFRKELEAAVNGRREIRKMTRNPVMLTALAVLQHNNVKLPEKRVNLYGSILEWLSKQRAKPGRLPAAECLLRLRELALAMQDHDEGRKKQVTLASAGGTLAEQFGGLAAAERFLRAEQSDSGIVVSRGREIAYWHLTFQEYLAALEIAGWEDADQHRLLLGGGAKIYRPEWRETVLLYGGLLHNMGPKKVDALVRKVLDRMGEKPSLADRAKCVGLIGALLPDLVGYEVSDDRYAESLRLVMDIFDAEKSKGVPFQDRLAAAEALGQAGDPRTKEIEWVTIPATKDYWIGAQKSDFFGPNYDSDAWDDEPPQKISLPAFQITKYPITVSQYGVFVEEGNVSGCAPEGWDEQLEHPNWPVVNVTWHQANAYCRWQKARLPSEDEWERATRGANGTKYPWGDEDIDPSRANYLESRIGHPTPVGLYPTGASPEGVLDLIGNILEWTESPRTQGTDAYAWRGGSFYVDRGIARSSFRYKSGPDAHFNGLGFRLAAEIK